MNEKPAKNTPKKRKTAVKKPLKLPQPRSPKRYG